MSKRKAGKSKPQPQPEPALESRKHFNEAILYIPVVVGLPLFFAWLLLLRGAPGQLYLLLLLLLAATLFSWLLRSIETQRLRFMAPYLAGLFFYGCVLMISLVTWNYLFQLYLSQVNFTGDIFRRVLRTYYAPIYGFAQIPGIGGYLYSLPSAGLFIFYLLKYGNKAIEEYGNLASMFFFMLFSVNMALTDDISRLTEWMAHYGYFAQGLPFFPDVLDLLRDYTLKMGQMGVHNNHYPPGLLLMLKFETLLNFQGLTRLLVMLSGLGALWALKATAKAIGGSDRCAQLAGFLFILSPGVLVYITADPGYMVIFPASLTLLLFLKGLITGNPAYALGMGVVFSAYTFFSFSSGFLAFLLGILFVLGWRCGLVRFSAALTQITLSMVTFTAAYIILYHATGFNLLVCLQEAVQNNAKQMSSGFDDGIRYLFRSTGAILAYLITAGIPLSYLFIRRVVKTVKEKAYHDLGNLLAIGLGVCLVGCGFSGFFFLETERIWLFFTPALAVAAAFEAERLYVDRGFAPIFAVLTSSILMSVVYELFLCSFSWR